MIGLNGATFDVIQPLIEEVKLPVWRISCGCLGAGNPKKGHCIVFDK